MPGLKSSIMILGEVYWKHPILSTTGMALTAAAYLHDWVVTGSPFGYTPAGGAIAVLATACVAYVIYSWYQSPVVEEPAPR